MAASSTSISNSTTIELFKNVYGQMHDIVPEDQQLSKDIGWAEGNRVGTQFMEDVVLGAETGITFGGNGQDAFEINPAIAGAVKQTAVIPYVTVLPSILPFATVSRSLGNEQAFMAATKFITTNNLKSHEKFLEIMRFYGQASKLLGYVSYATATYRGASFVAGTGTLPNGVTFTNGVNTTSKTILLAPGNFASGIWVGMQGVKVSQVDSTGVAVASGKLVNVNSKYGYITVDFTPVAASSTTSHRLCFTDQINTGELVGIYKVLTTSGTLFGINNSTFPLFRGNYSTLSQTKLTLSVLQSAIADAVNGGGLEGEVTCYVNPLNWSSLSNTEAGLRIYDKSYTPSSAQNGFMDIEYYSQNGRLTIKAHRCVMEGDCFVLKTETWKRSGSAQVGFKVPGMDQELIRELTNQAGFVFRSFADEYIFTYAPAQNLLIDGINPESAT